jgi:hypothetical protein
MKNSNDTGGIQNHDLPARRIKANILAKTTGQEKLRINWMLLVLADMRKMIIAIPKRKKLLKGKLPSGITFQCNEQGWMT